MGRGEVCAPGRGGSVRAAVLAVCALFAACGIARADSIGPTVNLWYGPEQTFGAPGIAQRWVNVLGNVSDPDGVSSLAYSLNGGSSHALSIGPDTRRLLKPGDFNIEIDFIDLNAGSNGIVITATDNAANTSITQMSLNFAAGNVWPLPVTPDLSGASAIQDVAQVVDGEWLIESNGLRCPVMGYDRVLAIGDLDWTNYEITATITMLDLDPAGYAWPSVSPGFGITLRWPGHSNSPVVCSQPHCGWLPSGATVWYNAGGNGPLTLDGDLGLFDSENRTLSYDVPYVFKMRAETVPGSGTFYATKVWDAATAEPGAWDLSGFDGIGDEPSGTAIFIAHHVDILVQDVNVVPISDTTPPVISNVQVVTTDGGATVSWNTDEVTTGAVAYGPTVAYEDGSVASPTSGTSHSVVLSGLANGATYHFQITADDLNSNETSTPDDTFVVQSDTDPPVISNLQIIPAVTSALVTWTTDEPATSLVDYGVTTGYGDASSNGALTTLHSVSLSGLDADTLYHCRIASADANGNAASSADQTFTTLAIPPGVLTTDQFNEVSLDTNAWTFVNPLGDATVAMTGTQVNISIPVTGSDHEIWIDGNSAPRIVQAAPDSDFEFVVKFDSPLTQQLQIQGIAVEQDANNVVRAEFHRLLGSTRIYVATIFGGVANTRIHQSVPLTAPMYLKVRREGDTFTVSRSQNGESYTVATSFSQPMTVTGVAIHAGASAGTAHSLLADYFLDTSDPPPPDCNGNGIDDAEDITAGTSADCNASNIPDECELAGDDCNANGTPDECDSDCNSNGTPDDCEAFTDCNANSVPDECELVGNDCNTNGVPDECDADCDASGTPDDCEVFADCNANGVPDACELVANDCNSNGVPDECDADCNNNGTPDDCETFSDCNANNVPDECDLVGNDCNSNGAPDECDADCDANGTPDDCEPFADCNASGIPDRCELAGNDCNANLIPDECEPDCNSNGTPDDCEGLTDCNTNAIPDVCELAGNDCDSNGVPDECDVDCNGNGTPDACEVFADCNLNAIPDECELTGNDCNANAVPDECDSDCNSNGTPDACETFDDCNTNGVPDACELAGNDCNTNAIPDECDVDCNANGTPDDCETFTDCNTNHVPDACELAGNDCNSNGVPDECDADCDGNGTPDNCESFVDCNLSGVPDRCELIANDCDSNGVPDECDVDCNTNGTPDDCEVYADCNTNGVPDECELAGDDCNTNAVPDECDTDCNLNGTPDDCEAFTDCNASGIPDECELLDNDCNTNGVPDECDVDCDSSGIPDDCEALADCNGNWTPDVCESFADCNATGVPDECELAGNDCNANGIPDECETDCNSNGTPDDCESFADCNASGVPDECELVGNDCNTNGVPDECDSDCDASGTPDDCEAHADCNTNALPDACDILAGTSLDENADTVPDECQVHNLTQQTVHASIADAIAAAFGGDTLRAPAGQFAIESLIDFADKDLRLESTLGISQPTGGLITLANGVHLATASGAHMTIDGTVTSGPFDDAELASTNLLVGKSGQIVVPVSAGLEIATHNGVVVYGSAQVQPLATLVVSDALSVAGNVSLYGGVLAAYPTSITTSGVLTGYGDVMGDVYNTGSTILIADTQFIGNYTNDGTTMIQGGTLTITGSYMGSGDVIGAFDKSKPSPSKARSAGNGLLIAGDFQIDSVASLLLPDAQWSLRVGGDFDVAIDDYSAFDLVTAELRMVGLGKSVQTLEVMSADIGADLAGLTCSTAGRFPIGTLRIGPTPTTVRLVDLQENASGEEAIYVDHLVIDAGATLLTNGHVVYYRTLDLAGSVDVSGNLVMLEGQPGDCDVDGDVDVADFAGLVDCLSGPGGTPPATASAGCGCLATFDLDADGDVDLRDVAGLLSGL
ncbi:MAG: fibronectin type III domain-containing protein [Phycisphaerales bacterium]|nr:fibronectin type III domain-containing protein [Phycisphaerales bacterium]